MRKRGKYEAKRVKETAKSSTASSSLMKTYMTSLLSLVLCVTMFLGTTMAWFTDEVGSKGNEIHVGSLKTSLTWNNGASTLSETSAENADTPIFGSDVMWIPDHLEIRELTLSNNGEIDFHYRLDAQLLDENGARLLNEGENTAQYNLASYFDVYYLTDDNVLESTPNNITEIKAENSGWTRSGTLAEVLQDEIICGDKMESDKTQFIYIALYMRTDTPSSYNGQTLENIYIFLTAYQDTALTPVNNAADLAAALKAGGTVVLSDDITVPADMTLEVPADKKVTLNLNGKALTGGDENLFDVKGSLILESGTVTATGGIAKVSGSLTISSGEYTTNGTAFTIESNGQVTINGGTVTAQTISSGDGSLTITGGNIIGTATKDIDETPTTVVVIDCKTVAITGGTFEPDNTVYLTLNVADETGITAAGLTVVVEPEPAPSTEATTE